MTKPNWQAIAINRDNSGKASGEYVEFDSAPQAIEADDIVFIIGAVKKLKEYSNSLVFVVINGGKQ